MKYRAMAGDVLGTLDVTCDSCGREIAVTDDRWSCVVCGHDYCSTSEACSNHQVFFYPGFPLLQSMEEVVAKGREHLRESCGPQVFNGHAGNIYLERIKFLMEFFELSVQGVDAAEQFARRGVDEKRIAWFQQQGKEFLQRWVSLREMGRYVDYFKRRAIPGRLPGEATWLHSQGGHAPAAWKGVPMMRTVWDFTLYPIIQHEVKPRTIIELGTAAGGSAIWYADVQKMHDMQPNVITVDVRPPPLKYPGVTFLHGDSHAIEKVLTPQLLAGQPHPWLFVEDAHVNLRGVLHYIHHFLLVGDYLIIEDRDAEREIAPFLSEKGRETYRVDARYADYFGHNATCAADQIFRRMT